MIIKDSEYRSVVSSSELRNTFTQVWTKSDAIQPGSCRDKFLVQCHSRIMVFNCNSIGLIVVDCLDKQKWGWYLVLVVGRDKEFEIGARHHKSGMSISEQLGKWEGWFFAVRRR